MTSWFRGEDMIFCEMYLHGDDAFECVNRLGDLGVCQFKDLNMEKNAFQRHFVNEIRNLEEMERIIRYFEFEIKNNKMENFMENVADPIQAKSLNDMIVHLENMEKELKELATNVEQLEKNHNDLIELSNVLTKTKTFFESIDPGIPVTGEPDVPDNLTESGGRATLRYTAGVIPVTKVIGFTRLLYFATKGASYLKTADIDRPIIDQSGNEINKTVFMAVCSGQQLHSKIRKIAEGFHANLYPCPDTSSERENMIIGVHQRLRDLEIILEKSREQKNLTLINIGKHLTSWKVKVLRLKAVYHTLNLFKYEGSSFVGQCWLPSSYLSKVQNVLNVSSDRASNIVTPISSPILLTYNKSNDFTSAFQNINDAYGVATYKEINPAIFSIITFPFLFSVMFGDAGHGFLLFLFSIFLCLKKSLKYTADSNEIFGIIYGGRFMILLMSFFSIYSGFMYNDVFSRSVAFVPSSWKVVYDEEYLKHNTNSMLDPGNKSVFSHCYPFGIDPVWKLSENQITFTNSYKKKISIIFGVSHMTLGVFVGLFNHIYFRKYLNILCDFIPMLLFLFSLFGYLSILMVAKWIMFYEGSSYYDCSPNLLIGFINMFLMSYSDNKEPSQCPDLWFPGQKPLQMTLLAVAIVSALWLLLSKPLFLYFKIRASSRFNHQRLVESSSHVTRPSGHNTLSQEGVSVEITPEVEKEEFDFGEVFVHQCIHTIEFCLGCISHTASYLRLWALSLAHAQLSEVLWTMVLRIGFVKFSGFVGSLVIFGLFTPFAVMTLVILILMEGLSAFLHTLRLHWVEFNSKFYLGEGILFEPFCFEKIIKLGLKDQT